MISVFTYGSAADSHLDLATRGSHQLGKLLRNTLEDAQAVVVGQGLQEVLDGLAAAGSLLELGDDGGLVGIGESRGAQDGGELGILLDEV